MSSAWRSALVVVALALASCGGGDDEEAAVKTTTAAAPPVPHEVNGNDRAGAQTTVVCAYDRAGVGGSADPPKSPRPSADVVSDLDAFLSATKVDPPYLLVGHSAGATFVFRYAQAHPDKVAGFVSMNPVPPYKTWIRDARKVETQKEVEDLELRFYRGEAEEPVDFRDTERMLTDPIPAAMPYAVMFDEDCGGDTAFCRRILPSATRMAETLAEVGEGGTFVRAKGAGHDIYLNDAPLVLKTIEEVEGAG